MRRRRNADVVSPDPFTTGRSNVACRLGTFADNRFEEPFSNELEGYLIQEFTVRVLVA